MFFNVPEKWYNLVMKLIKKNTERGEEKKKRPKKLKRIKNANPSVVLDRHGNIIRRVDGTEHGDEKRGGQFLAELFEKLIPPGTKAGNKKQKTEMRKKPKRKAESEYNEAVPYDFPGDIIRSIKNTAGDFAGIIGGKSPSAGKAGEEKRGGIRDAAPIRKLSAIRRKFMSLSKAMRRIVIALSALFVALVSVCAFNIWASGFRETWKAREASDAEKAALESILDEAFADERSEKLRPLPYRTTPAKLDVRAGAAVLVDTANGCVLYEKNADRLIPPASLTKLFVMYIVFKEVEAGKITMDDIVPLPELSWAVNLPRDASLMHLGQGQTVTLRELMAGLAVASGNDAARAVAYYISGTQEDFVARMNAECRALGLKKTYFVEPSGYDENNITTARELAEFARIYVMHFPQSIEEFHSLKSLDYPLQKNLPSWQKNYGDTLAIHHSNTNPLLGKLDGVDGLKTGFIYESGYNLALTASRNGQRFLSITLQGQGKGTKQGNEGRIHDGTELMEWAFSTFADYEPGKDASLVFPVPSLASKGNDGKFVNLVPAWKNKITVPHLFGSTAKDSADAVKVVVDVPPYLYGGVKLGAQYGSVKYKLGEITLETVPLVADRSLESAGITGRFFGTLAKGSLEKNR